MSVHANANSVFKREAIVGDTMSYWWQQDTPVDTNGKEVLLGT